MLNNLDRNLVRDEDAPPLFTKRAIYGFSVFFTVIFGAVLLAINLKENPKARTFVILFGIAYTSFAIYILNIMERSTSLTLLVNMVGAAALNSFFWDRYIGKNTSYRAKQVWKPLIISILIAIPFIWAAVITM